MTDDFISTKKKKKKRRLCRIWTTMTTGDDFVLVRRFVKQQLGPRQIATFPTRRHFVDKWRRKFTSGRIRFFLTRI